jgi:LmbE family N-acetylglucosaminyl deacetylase
MTPLRILIIGAHPDDVDIKAGGSTALWTQAGHRVQLISVTDGGAGHQTLRRPALVQRRRAEAKAAGAIVGADYTTFDFPDGELQPTLEARFALIRLIRTFNPDLVLTHRPNDYHPDHRYTAQLVQDAAYMITVPAICPDAPHLDRNPVIMSFSDDFRKPVPFVPDVVVDVGPVFSKIVDMLDCHVSQFYEWLPFNSGTLDQVPASPAERKAWLDGRMRKRIRPLADRYRDKVTQTYGPEEGRKVEYIEAFELSEYGSPLDGATRARLFPFLPAVQGEDSSASLVQEWVDLRADD